MQVVVGAIRSVDGVSGGGDCYVLEFAVAGADAVAVGVVSPRVVDRSAAPRGGFVIAGNACDLAVLHELGVGVGKVDDDPICVPGLAHECVEVQVGNALANVAVEEHDGIDGFWEGGVTGDGGEAGFEAAEVFTEDA